jgi:hypothetical protein
LNHSHSNKENIRLDESGLIGFCVKKIELGKITMLCASRAAIKASLAGAKIFSKIL